jgi:26S proteasome non-ATPase regulatory subunit 5
MAQEPDTKRQKTKDSDSKILDLIQQLVEHSETGLEDYLSVINRALEGEKGLKEFTSEKIKPYIVAALDSPSARIRQFLVEQFKRLCRTSDGIKYLKENGFVKKIVELLADSNIGVTERAAECLVEMVKLPEGVNVVFEGDTLLNIMRLYLRKNDDNLKFRILDIAAQFAGLGEPVFGLISKSGFLEYILQELDNDDLLIQLNAIELLEKISRSAEGISYLAERGVLEKMVAFLKSDESILIAKTLTFFGFVGSRSDFHFGKIVNFPLKEIFLEHMNNENAESTIATVAAIAISPLGLQWLLSDNKLYNILRSTRSDQNVK